MKTSTKNYIACSCCERLISSPKETRLHPLLRTPQCSSCNNTYNNVGDLSKYRGGVERKNGENNYCRLCLDGGQLIICAEKNCKNRFCDICLERNLGVAALDTIRQSNDWLCLSCNDEQLRELRRKTNQFIHQLSITRNPEPVPEPEIRAVGFTIESQPSVVPTSQSESDQRLNFDAQPLLEPQLGPHQTEIPAAAEEMVQGPELEPRLDEPIPEPHEYEKETQIALQPQEEIPNSLQPRKALPEPAHIPNQAPEVLPPRRKIEGPDQPHQDLSGATDPHQEPPQTTGPQKKHLNVSKPPKKLLDTAQTQGQRPVPPQIQKKSFSFDIFSSTKLSLRPPTKGFIPEPMEIEDDTLESIDVSPPIIENSSPETAHQSSESEDNESIHMDDDDIPDAVEKELILSDDDTNDTNDASDKENNEKGPTDWVLTNAELLKERLQVFIKSLNSSVETYNDEQFRSDPKSLLSWVDNIQTFLSFGPLVDGRCQHLRDMVEVVFNKKMP